MDPFLYHNRNGNYALIITDRQTDDLVERPQREPSRARLLRDSHSYDATNATSHPKRLRPLATSPTIRGHLALVLLGILAEVRIHPTSGY